VHWNFRRVRRCCKCLPPPPPPTPYLISNQDGLLSSIEGAAPSDESLVLLSAFFGQKLLTQSLELAEAVVKVVCQSSGRVFFRIQGKDANPYLVVNNFCTCRAFEGHALGSNRALFCKHGLAVLLSDKWKVRSELSHHLHIHCAMWRNFCKTHLTLRGFCLSVAALSPLRQRSGATSCRTVSSCESHPGHEP
jgi:hypothetical protein